MVQQLTNGLLDFSSVGNTAYQILESRNLHDAIEEMTTIELANFFDRNFYLFDVETPQQDVAEIAIDILELSHFRALMERNIDKTVYEMLVAEGYVNKVDGITVLSIDCPLSHFN